MSVNRRVYKVKRYTRSSRRRSVFPGRLVIVAGIAAAVVVVVVLFVTGVFTWPQAKDASAEAQTSAAASVMPAATPSAAPSPTPSPSPSPSPTPEATPSAARELSLTDPHMQGDDVKALQEKLGITADGSFGPSTRTALKEWQEENGLPADGIAGPETLEKLGL